MVDQWQNAVVALAVLAAALYLARSSWRAIAVRKAGCGACSTCPAEKSTGPEVVSIDTLGQSARQLRDGAAEPTKR